MSYFRPNNPLIRHTRVERNKLPEANLLPAAHTELINKSREDEIGLNKDYCGARINVCSVKEYVCVYTQAAAAAVVAGALIISPFFPTLFSFKRPRAVTHTAQCWLR
jgi:hypothetical protein